MPDKTVDIDFNTHSDTSGAKEAQDAIKDLSQEVDNATDSGQKYVGGQREIIDSNKDLSKSTEDSTESIKENTKAKIENSNADDGSTRERRGGRDPSKQLPNLEKTEGRFNKLNKAIRGTGGTALKSGARILGLFGIITAGGEFLGRFTSKVGESGKSIEGLGDDLELTGQVGSGFIQWIGRSVTKLKEFGGTISRTLNPIGAYIKSTRELADAQRKLAKTEEEVQRKLEKRIEKIKKQVKVINDSAKAQETAKVAAEELERIQTRWANSIAKVNRGLQLQKDLLEENKGAAADRIDDAERDALAGVENDEQDGVINTAQAEAKKLEIFKKFSTQRERLERKAFFESEKLREKELGEQQRQLSRDTSRSNSLDSINNNFLTPEEQNSLSDNRKKFRSLGQEEEVVDIDLRLKRNQEAQRKARDEGFTDKGALESALESLSASIASAKTNIENLKDTGTVNRVKEDNRRDDARRDFTSERDERVRDVAIAEREAERGGQVSAVDNEARSIAERVGQAAVNGLKAGKAEEAKVLQDIERTLQDGTNSEELRQVVAKISAIQGQTESAILSALTQNLAKLESQSAKIKQLEERIKLN